MSFHTDTCGFAPLMEKQKRPLPAAVFFTDGEGTIMNIKQIERLREAAKEHGEVSDLLGALAASFPYFCTGDKYFYGSEIDAEILKSALIASEFSAFDREQLSS